MQVVLRELVHRNLADFGDDVVVDSVLVALLRCLSDFGLGEILIPEVQPIPEGHIGLDLLASSAVFLAELFEPFLTLRFRFRGYAFGFSVAVFLVAYDESAFPSAVMALKDRSVTVFSFCHITNHSFRLRKLPFLRNCGWFCGAKSLSFR